MIHVRFSPPQFALQRPVRWALLRAFGPLDVAAPEVDGLEAEQTSRRLDLCARIATRLEFERLREELGEIAAARLFERHMAALAQQQRVRGAALRLAERAAEPGIPLVWLKGVALDVSGVLGEGSRGTLDVDVLAPEGKAEVLHRQLQGEGYRLLEERRSERHLPALEDPRGGAVEIHTRVLGIRLSSGRSASFGDFLESGMLAPLPSWQGSCFVPRPHVLAAHLAVHGLVQHGARPLSYPMTRVLADLIDLNVTFDDLSGSGLLAAIAQEMAAAEVGGLLDLAESLRVGTIPATSGPESEELMSVVLRHLVAAYFREDYALSLELVAIGRPLSDEHRAPWILRRLRSVFFPTRRQLEVAYGPREGLRSEVGRRLRRPFDLLGLVSRAWLAGLRRLGRMRDR